MIWPKKICYTEDKTTVSFVIPRAEMNLKYDNQKRSVKKSSITYTPIKILPFRVKKRQKSNPIVAKFCTQKTVNSRQKKQEKSVPEPKKIDIAHKSIQNR